MILRMRPIRRLFLVLFLFPSLTLADDIQGVQPAALDQPRIFLNVRRTASGPALIAKAEGESSTAVEAFLDTGASGIMLAADTYKALGVKPAMLPPPPNVM